MADGYVRKLFGASLQLFAGDAAVLAITMLQSIVLARALGVSQFGVWALAHALSAVALAFFSFRLTDAVTSFLVEARQKQNHNDIRFVLSAGFWIQFVSGLVAMVIVFLAAPAFAQASNLPLEVVIVFWLRALTLPLGAMNGIWMPVLRDGGRYRLIASTTAFLAGMQLVGITALWALGTLTLFSALLVFVMTEAVRAIVSVVQFKNQLRTIGIDRWLRLDVRTLWRERYRLPGFANFLGFGYLSSSVSATVKEADILILGLVRSESEVGIYRVAKSLALVGMRLASGLVVVIYQDFSERIHEDRYAELGRNLLGFLKLWVPLVIASVAIGIFFGPLFINLAYGEDFAPARAPFIILVTGVGAATLLMWIQPFSLATRRVKLNFVAVLVSAIVFYTMIGMFVHSHGAIGVAAGLAGAWTVGYVTLLIANARNLRRVFHSFPDPD